MPDTPSAAPEWEMTRLFESWMHAYGDSILRLCFVYLCDRQQAEDATQDTFLKAWGRIDQLAAFSEQALRAWLFRVAINTCRDYHRSRWFRYVDRAKALEDLPLATLSVEPEDTSLLLDILRLPIKYKQVVLLYHYQDFTLAETAKILSLSTSAVHYRLQKAYQLLKRSLTGGPDHAR